MGAADPHRKKEFEFRSWKTNIRGRVYVYATKTLSDVDPEVLVELGGVKLEDLPRGVIAGSVAIMDCEPDTYGGWAWKLAQPTLYPQPYKVAGHVQPGFWRPKL